MDSSYKWSGRSSDVRGWGRDAKHRDKDLNILRKTPTTTVSSCICWWAAKVQLADTDPVLVADDGKLIIAEIHRFSGLPRKTCLVEITPEQKVWNMIKRKDWSHDSGLIVNDLPFLASGSWACLAGLAFERLRGQEDRELEHQLVSRDETTCHMCRSSDRFIFECVAPPPCLLPQNWSPVLPLGGRGGGGGGGGRW